MDSLAFRLANILVGNEPGETALEYQFIGPELRCFERVSLAIVGGDSQPQIDGHPIPMGTVISVATGQRLTCGTLRTGARAYLAVSGGFAKEMVLGSAATFPRGGIGGGAIKRDEELFLKQPSVRCVGHQLSGENDLIDKSEPVEIEVTAGPHLDWLSKKGRDALFGVRWRVSSRSDRTGIRLEGPPLHFADRALDKAPENGIDPSNVINTGYPIGGVNICGNTPIILPVDGPSQGGFITPIVVVSAALRKVGQLRPNQFIRFRRVTLDQAISLRRELDSRASSSMVEVRG
jgi:urea carboxylase